MSFYVLCGGIVGLLLKEWKCSTKKPVAVLCIGCLVIIWLRILLVWVWLRNICYRYVLSIIAKYYLLLLSTIYY